MVFPNTVIATQTTTASPAMNFTVPDGVPSHVASRLEQLKADYDEGLITDKGYVKKYHDILSQAKAAAEGLHSTPISCTGNRVAATSTLLPASSFGTQLSPVDRRGHSKGASSTLSFRYPSDGDNSFPNYGPNSSNSNSNSNSNNYGHGHSRSYSQNQSYYQSPYGSGIYPGQGVFPEPLTPNMYPSPSQLLPPPVLPETGDPNQQRKLQQPLKPRDLSSLNSVEKYDSLPMILRQRARTYAKDVAILTVQMRGKETNAITWEKLYLKAEKVAQQISKKAGLYKGDRVTLIYADYEVIDFAIAFFGCLLAGMIAVPISDALSLDDTIKVILKTQSHLCLTSESVFKELEKWDNDSKNKFVWPKQVTFWKTKDMGTYQRSKKYDPPALNLPDLAYIEFSKYPIDLKGVVLSHKTIMHQMSNLSRIVTSSPNVPKKIERDVNVRKEEKEPILCTCDVRCSSGLVMGFLFTVYTGTLLVWTPVNQMEIPGFYANLITKYRISILLSDLLDLKAVAFNYQSDPAATRKFDRKKEVNLSCVKWCLISCLTVNNEVLEIIADRWLKPLGCEKAREVIAPALSLSEYGGMIMSIRDWIGKEDKLGAEFSLHIGDDDSEQPYSASDLSEVLIDKESLSTNTVKIISDRPPPQSANFDSKLYTKYIRVGAFGFPLLDSALAIVNPETCMLTTDREVGEIWVDSPCLSGGYWDSPEDTNNIFHARCRDYNGHLELDFLRTGLLGFVFNGKVYALGLYEDRFRQRVTWLDKKLQNSLSEIQEEDEEQGSEENKALVYDNGYRYHYSDHIASTVFRKVSPIECVTFDILLNGEHVPIIVMETDLVTKKLYAATIDYEALEALAISTFKTLEKQHKVRVFCCCFTSVRALPRAHKSGRTEIANMLCKTEFLRGRLRISYLKFNIRSSISNVTRGIDMLGGIWSPYSSAIRRDSIVDLADRQYTGLDQRDESVDERSHARLSDFKTIVDVLKWRVLNQPESLAFALINDHKKDLSWKKFDQKVYSVCQYILDKTFLKPGQYVILMYNLSEDYICSLYACFLIGLVPIPMLPIDTKRVEEDTKAYYRVVKDFNIKMVFVNHETEATVFKSKPTVQALKTLFMNQKQPIIKNTSRAKSVKNVSDLRSRIAFNQAKVDFRSENTTVLVCLNWTPDGKRIGIRYTHKVLINICKILKETFKMSSFNSILASIDHSAGVGFVQSALLGVYLGCSTYLFSYSTYNFSPMTFYNGLANYKIKDTFLTSEMLVHAVEHGKQPKTFSLDKLKNVMVTYSGRPEPLVISNFKDFMSPTKLVGSSVNTVYGHRFNPLIASRSYLNLVPVDLWLDPAALRKGYVSIVNPVEVPNALHVQDSGVVLCCTQVAIVNPQTEQVCKAGEFGEIWVYSEGNAVGYTNGIRRNENEFLIAQFNGHLKGFDFQYLRTGDLGFIHTVNQPSIDGTPLEVQLLFVLGNIAETFEVLGLHHFAYDVEKTLESCHLDIYKHSSLVFKSEGYTIALCCPKRKEYLASLVPIIFKSVLNSHQLMIDIVAFLPVGEFERSRLFEKKRATMINKWNNNQLPFLGIYGVNYGESSMISMVKDMEGVEEAPIFSDHSNGDMEPVTTLSSVSSISEKSLQKAEL